MKRKLYWKITVALAVLLTILMFSPIVIAPGKTDPKLFSLPYTLWASVLITILIVVLTYVGGLLYLRDEEEDQ